MNGTDFQKRAFKAATIVGTLVFGSALGVFFLRTKPDWTGIAVQRTAVQYIETDNPQAPYRLAPFQKVFLDQWTLATNSRGDREGLELQSLNSDCDLTLVVGSSMSLGYGVSENLRYSSRMGPPLQRKTGRCQQIYNASQEGLSWVAKEAIVQDLLAKIAFPPKRIILDLTSFDWGAPLRIANDRPAPDPLNPGSHREVHKRGLMQAPWIDRRPQNGQHLPPAFMDIWSWLPRAWKDQLPPLRRCREDSCLNLAVQGRGPDGQPWPMRHRSAVYFTPKYVNQMVDAMIRINRTCSGLKIECQVLEFDTSLEDLRVAAELTRPWTPLPHLQFINLERFAGQSFFELEKRFSIGDGFHLNAGGHDLAFQALMASADQQRGAIGENAWKTYTASRRQSDLEFVETLGPFVDAATRVNFHQLVSPVEVGASLGPIVRSQEILLGRGPGHGQVRATGINVSTHLITIELKVWGGFSEPSIQSLEVGGGAWELSLPLKGDSKLIHAQLSCLSEKGFCSSIRWSRIETR